MTSPHLSATVAAVPVVQPGEIWNRKVTDDRIIQAYALTKSIQKAGDILGLNRASVHERLVKLGITCNGSGTKWTTADRKRLEQEYPNAAAAGKLSELAAAMRRTKHFICKKAKEIGLTNQKRDKPYAGKWKYMDEQRAAKLWRQFQKSSLGLGQFCRKNGLDDLGFSRAMKTHFADEWEHVIEAKQPRQTHYRIGRQVEYAVRDDLKKRGYPVVLRSPRSGGPVDILALKFGSQLLVQAKRSLALSVKEWNGLLDLADSVGAVAVLAGRPTGRGLVYKRLVARKDGSKKAQPMVDFEP